MERLVNNNVKNGKKEPVALSIEEPWRTYVAMHPYHPGLEIFKQEILVQGIHMTLGTDHPGLENLLHSLWGLLAT